MVYMRVKVNDSKILSTSWGKGLVLVDDHKLSQSLLAKVNRSRALLTYISYMPVMRMAYHPYQLNHAQQFCRNIGGYCPINKYFLPILGQSGHSF